ncbi:MAG TPA: hypothetical protein VHX15_11855 [Frankiaceae bacterium]|nr:hypothetical protein [Frankiaceae bacterium]
MTAGVDDVGADGGLEGLIDVVGEGAAGAVVTLDRGMGSGAIVAMFPPGPAVASKPAVTAAMTTATVAVASVTSRRRRTLWALFITASASM